jgi:hypothetical protein
MESEWLTAYLLHPLEVEQPVDFGLVPGLCPLVKVISLIDLPLFQGCEVVLEGVLGKVVLSDRLAGMLAVRGNTEAVVPLFTRR